MKNFELKFTAIFFLLVICITVASAQVSIPYEKYYHHETFPRSNEKVTFSLIHPFLDYPDSVPDVNSTYQYLGKLTAVSDSAMNQYIKFAMLSLNFELKYNNYRKGAEVWYGVTKTTIPTVTGIYYKSSADSTSLYIITGYSMTYFDKKSKSNLSALINERIRSIQERDLKRRSK